jgi:hypothetical protein
MSPVLHRYGISRKCEGAVNGISNTLAMASLSLSQSDLEEWLEPRPYSCLKAVIGSILSARRAGM